MGRDRGGGVAVDVAGKRGALGARQRLRLVRERVEILVESVHRQTEARLGGVGFLVRSDTNTLSMSVTVAWESPIGSVRLRPRAVSRSAVFPLTLR